MKIKEIFSTSLKQKINTVFGSKKDRKEILEELEEILVLSDISIDLVGRILQNLEKKIKTGFEKEDFIAVLKEEIRDIFSAVNIAKEELPGNKNIILLVGVNGSGKTTTAAKLGDYYRNRGKKVLFAAADTFRAAGGSQLVQWGERLGLPVISGDRGADPGSVVYNSLMSFNSKDFDILIIDTAGRVQTKDNLMKELEKLSKIIKKVVPGGAAQVLLVIDATMGQNTLDQARKFKEFSGITGIVLAKIDGTARGGTVVNIVDEMKIPVKFLGTGEKAGDILEFSPDEFIDSLLS
ncbi:MAG: signal recognition particle-docking protein FtsY [Candidatus Aminicenantes bacterium]|nr:signal recognition particle-docking protein FtsY [Candidatus Aminicenantes bacterium]